MEKQTTTKKKPPLHVFHSYFLLCKRAKQQSATVLKVRLFLPSADADPANGNLINQQLKAILLPSPPPLAHLENDMFFFTMFSPPLSLVAVMLNALDIILRSPLTVIFFEYYASNKTPDLESFKWPLAWVTPISSAHLEVSGGVRCLTLC